jgi:hypothetical protein
VSNTPDAGAHGRAPLPQPTTEAQPRGVTLNSFAALRDFIPREPEKPKGPDTGVAREVFPWLAARIGARRRENLPVSDASLRADVTLGFAAQVGAGSVWPEALYGGENGPRLNLLVRQPEPRQRIAVACQYPRRANPGQLPMTARQLGDLLRDALRLARSFDRHDDLPLQVLLCTDEFRTYLAGLRPPLRLLRGDGVGGELRVDLPLDSLDEGALNRLTDAVTPEQSTLHLAFEVLGYAPVGPLHLGMWRVVDARPG